MILYAHQFEFSCCRRLWSYKNIWQYFAFLICRETKEIRINLCRSVRHTCCMINIDRYFKLLYKTMYFVLPCSFTLWMFNLPKSSLLSILIQRDEVELSYYAVWQNMEYILCGCCKQANWSTRPLQSAWDKVQLEGGVFRGGNRTGNSWQLQLDGRIG